MQKVAPLYDGSLSEAGDTNWLGPGYDKALQPSPIKGHAPFKLLELFGINSDAEGKLSIGLSAMVVVAISAG